MDVAMAREAPSRSHRVSFQTRSEFPFLIKGFLIWIIGATIHFRWFLTSGHNLIAGNVGDNRFCMAMAEHWYNVYRGFQAWNAPGFFFPEPGVVAYSVTYFLESIPYSALRALGCDAYVAFEGQFIILTLIGFASTAYLLRNYFGVRASLALFGAALFTFSNINYIWLYSAQNNIVMLIPLVLLLVARGLIGGSRISLAVAGWLLGLTLFAEFYTGWFLIVFLLLFGAAYTYLVGVDRLRWREIAEPSAVMGAGAIVGLIPFFATYGSMIVAGVRRDYSEAARDLLNVSDLWNVDGGNLIWGRVICAHCNLGSAYGFPLATLLCCIAAGLCFTLHLLRGSKDALTRLVVALSAAIGLTVLSILHFRDFSLWVLFWQWLPGGSIIRVPGRFLIVAGFFIACVMVAALESWFRKAGARIRYALVFLCALLLAEQLNVESFHTIRRDEELRRMAVQPPPKVCNVFFVTSRDTGPQWYQMQIDAMLISQRFHIPTINGYSGITPVGWNLGEPRDPAYLEHVKEWLARKQYRGNVCSLDLPAGQWIQQKLN